MIVCVCVCVGGRVEHGKFPKVHATEEQDNVREGPDPGRGGEKMERDELLYKLNIKEGRYCQLRTSNMHRKHRPLATPSMEVDRL